MVAGFADRNIWCGEWREGGAPLIFSENKTNNSGSRHVAHFSPPRAGGGELLERSGSNSGEGAVGRTVPLPQFSRAVACSNCPLPQGEGAGIPEVRMGTLRRPAD